MGAYFSVIGIKNVSAAYALEALRNWENAEGDSLDAFRCSSGNSVLLCDTILADGSGLAQGLAKEVDAPVILLTFADDVVWSYELYTASGLQDEFSSRPRYWKTDPNLTRLAGNAHIVCRIWGDVTADQISHYLSDKSRLTEEQNGGRAYPDDTACNWDGWQMCDFMRRLGLEYPVDEDGESTVPHEGSVVVATVDGLQQKARMQRASAEVDEMVARLKEDGKWPG